MVAVIANTMGAFPAAFRRAWNETQNGVTTDGSYDGHVERGADFGASSPDGSAPRHTSAVTVVTEQGR